MALFQDTVLPSLGKRLIARNETIAVAESVTSGAIQWALSSIPDASLFLQGGITVYNLAQKTRQLGIDYDRAKACNCVSQEIANEMAASVIKRFVADWSIGITGYASPVPESDGKLYAFYAICYRGIVEDMGELLPPHENPVDNQHWLAMTVLDKLSMMLD